jgi:hypothetical protein
MFYDALYGCIVRGSAESVTEFSVPCTYIYGHIVLLLIVSSTVTGEVSQKEHWNLYCLVCGQNINKKKREEKTW